MKSYQEFGHLMRLYHATYHPQYTNFAGASVPLGIFPNPRCLVEALHKAIDGNVAGYVSALGPQDIRECIAQYENKKSGKNIHDWENVALIPGSATAAIGYLFDQLLSEPGSEIIVPVPNYWLPLEYVDRKLSHVNVKKIQSRSQNNFLPSVEQIADAISNETKVLFLCNPLNPSGWVHTEDELAEIIDLASKFGTYVLSDESCYDLMYSGHKTPSIAKVANGYDRTIVVRSWSKDRGRPDINLGYIICNPNLLAERDEGVIYDDPGRMFLPFVRKDMQMRTRMLEEELSNDEEFLEYKETVLGNLEKFRRNTSCAVGRLRQSQYIDQVIEPHGGFTVFFHVNHPLIQSGFQFVQNLFDKTGITTLPGSTLGMQNDPPWIRLSLACALERTSEKIEGAPRTYVKEGVDRVCEYLDLL